jgi:hypothetical protein
MRLGPNILKGDSPIKEKMKNENGKRKIIPQIIEPPF